MKKQTKIKIAAISAGFTFATFVSTIILVAIEHPAQWYVAGACMLGMCVGAFFGVTIED